MLSLQRLMAGIVVALALGTTAATQAPVPPLQPTPVLSDSEQERFLTVARIARVRPIGKGVTDSQRATLTDGTVTHDAQIQTVDERKREFSTPDGLEIDFVDSWKFNVAAYRLDRMLGLELVPVSVPRDWRTSRAAYTWWVDDVMMDEGGRIKSGAAPPHPRQWTEQMQLVRLFDELIYNIDRNLGNLLITKGWRVWAIDHTRAFRTRTTLRKPENVTRCDRQVFERLKQLDRASLQRELGKVLDAGRIRAVLARRDAIVKRLEDLGPSALFDRTPAASGGDLQLGLPAVGRGGFPLEHRAVRHLQRRGRQLAFDVRGRP
jgi:hypothetical protein